MNLMFVNLRVCFRNPPLETLHYKVFLHKYVIISRIEQYLHITLKVFLK